MTPLKLFLRCALPNMISMAVVSLYTIADGVFVGHYIGAEALAAINLVMPLIMMSFALSDMVAVGSSVQIAIWLGKEMKNGRKHLLFFLSFNFAFCCCNGRCCIRLRLASCPLSGGIR